MKEEEVKELKDVDLSIRLLLVGRILMVLYMLLTDT